MRFPPLVLGLFLALTALAGCGDQALTTPESLPITTYPKDKEFTMTVVMKSCSDVCAVYETPSCSVTVEDNTIELSIEVPYERDDSKVCSERCGSPILAHCTVAAISAGTYTVQSGTFRAEITVQ